VQPSSVASFANPFLLENPGGFAKTPSIACYLDRIITFFYLPFYLDELSCQARRRLDGLCASYGKKCFTPEGITRNRRPRSRVASAEASVRASRTPLPRINPPPGKPLAICLVRAGPVPCGPTRPASSDLTTAEGLDRAGAR